MEAHFFQQYQGRIFAFLGLIAGFAAYGAFLAAQNMSTQVVDWLPAEFEETKELLEFAEQFGSEEFVMVSWPGCTLDDPRVIQMARELRKTELVEGQEVLFFDPVLTGPEVLEDLQREPLNLKRSSALRRLRGILVGPPSGKEDPPTTCIVLALADPANVDRHRAIGFVRDCADRVGGLSRERIHMAGNTVDSVVIDEASQSVAGLSLLAFGVSILFAFASFRHFGLAVVVFLAAILNQQITLSLVHYTGWHMDTVLLMAPPLVYVLSISAGVHLVNYYGDSVREEGLAGAAERAVRLGLMPCVMAALTTSLGLIALQASYLVPLQRFGLYSAGGVLIGTGVLFLLVPLCLSAFPPVRWAQRIQDTSGGSSRASQSWDSVLAIVNAGRYPILITAAILLVAGLVGVGRTKGSAFLHDMFSPDARILQDYDWLESHVGPMVPIEVVLRTPAIPRQHETYDTPMLDRMGWVRAMQRTVASVDDIEATVSALTFAPSIPRKPVRGLRLGERIRRTSLEKTLRRRREEFVRLGYLRETRRELAWRISGHVPAGRRADYDQVMRDLNDRLGPVLAEVKKVYPKASMTICGGVPLVQRAQKQLVEDLVTSFTAAFGLIAGAMVTLSWAVSFGDFRRATSWMHRFRLLINRTIAGMLSMAPNVLPCVVVFGAMGWLDVNVEIGTVMTAAAAMGIAVDDTLHFVIWFRRGRTNGQTQREAVLHAYQRCGSAMVQTSLICGFGLLVFAASPFGPTQRFAWLIFTMLMMALLADLFVLPAILVSRLGRFFASDPQQPAKPDMPARSVA